MYEMNKDLPYEQQVKLLLHHYDQLVVENKALKARIKEMEDEKAEYGDPKELREMLKTLPSKVKQPENSITSEIQESTGLRKKW